MTDVFLAPGHGTRPDGRLDPGASTPDGRTEQSEGDRILRIAERRMVDVYGLSVVRQPAGGPNFVGTIGQINDLQPEVAVEGHHDWIRAPRGGFGFVLPSGHPDRHKMRVAQGRVETSIRNAYVAAGLPTRKVMHLLPGTSSPPAITAGTTVPTVLWEIDRIGAVDSPVVWADAIADGIAGYLGADEIAPPDGRVHVVRAGETLSQIARRYGVTVDAIVAANRIADPDLIVVGQRLTIPGRTPTPTPPREPWEGKRVVALADVRFYRAPGWHPANPSAGILQPGYGFRGGIHRKVTVGGGSQYEVSNSSGHRYYITANPRYVRLVSR